MDSRKTINIRLAALAAATLVVAACGGGGGGMDGGGETPPMNSAPTLSAIENQSMDQDTTRSLDFGIADRESDSGSLAVSIIADGTSLFPADGVELGGSGATRTLKLTPLEAATGTTNFAIRVADPAGAATTRSFSVAVNAKHNSLRTMALDTFAKAESDAPTPLNGWTIQQDADDPAAFAGLIPAEEPEAP